MGRQYYPGHRQKGDIYIIKPRYSQYWEKDNLDTLRTLAALRRAGLSPEFLLAEQILSEPLPAKARLFYLPETFKYEDPKVLERVLASGKPIFFGLNQSEPYTPDKKPCPPLYGLLGLKRMDGTMGFKSPQFREVQVSFAGKLFPVTSNFPHPNFQSNNSENLVVATYRSPWSHPSKVLPLVWDDSRLIFLAASDYQILFTECRNHLQWSFIADLICKNLLSKFSSCANY
ncbi:MAG: hypothetical protein P8X58_14015 [Syntrophobacterales bacterium]